MLRKFKVTYIKVEKAWKTPKERTVQVEAYSKYNAKQRFYVMYPSNCEVVKVEEVEE